MALISRDWACGQIWGEVGEEGRCYLRGQCSAPTACCSDRPVTLTGH